MEEKFYLNQDVFRLYTLKKIHLYINFLAITEYSFNLEQILHGNRLAKTTLNQAF